MHDITDDGFGIDGVVVGTVAPMPLPSTLLLMAPAFGLLAGLRRWRGRARVA